MGDIMNLDYYFKRIDELSFKELFKDCNYVTDIFDKLNSYVLENVTNKSECNAECSKFVSLSGNYIIGKNTKISDFVVIEGPVLIGDNVNIMPGAYIRPYSIIGDNCVIGHGSEIKHAIIMDNAKVASNTFVGDSIIGYKTRVGSGTIIANRRFDQGNVILKNGNEVIDLKTDFFGSVIGDKTRLGSNVTTYPGTFIGANTWIYPNTVVKGFIESLKRVSNVKELYITDNKEYELK